MGGCCIQNEDIGTSRFQGMAVGGGAAGNNVDYMGQLGGGDLLVQRLMLTISCQNLPNLDKKSKTDAFCVLYEIKNGIKSMID